LKRVKTELRTTIGGDRLEALLIIATGWDIDIDYGKVINTFAAKIPLLAKKKKNLFQQLILLSLIFV